jgi:hypothetical protein
MGARIDDAIAEKRAAAVSVGAAGADVRWRDAPTRRRACRVPISALFSELAFAATSAPRCCNSL